jgi:hypothetical protein
MDEMTDEQDAIKAQIPSESQKIAEAMKKYGALSASGAGLAGGPLGLHRADAQREKALTMAIHAFAEAEDYDADKIVEAAEKFAAFLAGLVTIKGDTNACLYPEDRLLRRARRCRHPDHLGCF